jgi:hypothetical protein
VDDVGLGVLGEDHGPVALRGELGDLVEDQLAVDDQYVGGASVESGEVLSGVDGSRRGRRAGGWRESRRLMAGCG